MFASKHFDSNSHFIQEPTSADSFRKIRAFGAPTRDLKEEVLASRGAEEDREQVLLFHDLLDKCLALDPSKRITVFAALQHPFFQLTTH